MNVSGFETTSLQGHPSRLAIDSSDVLEAFAENIAKLDIMQIHAADEKRRNDLRWTDTLKRIRADRNRPGQLSASDVPGAVFRKGGSDGIEINWIDDYIAEDLRHNINNGMAVFKFWSDNTPIYAATLIDKIHTNGEVWEWHVELYRTRKDANREVAAVKQRIKEKVLPVANDNVRKTWERAA